MDIVRLLIVILIVAMVLGYPGFGWHGYGYWPSGLIGILVLILILKVLGVI